MLAGRSVLALVQMRPLLGLRRAGEAAPLLRGLKQSIARMSSWRRVAGRPRQPGAPSSKYGPRASQSGRPSPSAAQPKESMLVFHSDRTRFFRLLSFTAVVQAVFWLSAASLAPAVQERNEDGTARESPLYRRYGLTVACLLMATLFGSMGVMIPRRYVTEMVLKRSTSSPSLQLETYTFFGRRTFEVPVNAVDFTHARSSAIGKDMIPFRIHQHRFFYLLDTRVGEVSNMQKLRKIMRLT